MVALSTSVAKSRLLLARLSVPIFWFIVLASINGCAPDTVQPTTQASKQTNNKSISKKPISATRTDAAIQRVFYRDAVKKPIYQLFLQQLKQDPELQGKVLFRIGIDRYGKVQRCDLIKTFTADKMLEQNICQIVMKTNFGEVRDPVPAVFTYPIDFLTN